MAQLAQCFGANSLQLSNRPTYQASTMRGLFIVALVANLHGVRREVCREIR